MKPEPLGWRPGLDGLRGLAVLAVMLYHFEATRDWFPGGSLGVDLFFVLSGFLITTLLLEERFRTGVVSLVGFYKRRARRLLPALMLFLALFTAITVVAQQPGVDELPLTVLTSQFYVFNWLDDFGGVATPGAGHLWSLSVEEQFYLLWPVIVIFAARTGQKVLLGLSLVMFVTAASLPAWSGRGYGELYSGTDFRAQELMAGAILAQLRFSGAITPSTARRVSFGAALMLSIIFYVVFLLTLENRDGFLYAGLYTVAAIAGAVLVCAALYVPPRILTNPIIRYVGTRSYALYLWHHAIAFWLRDADAIPGLVVSVALSFAAAEISWQLVERRGSLLVSLTNIVRQRLTNRDSGRAAARPSIAVRSHPRPSE